MTELLEQVMQRVEALSAEQQNAIAAQILETPDDEEAWERSFQERPEILALLEREAREAHLRDEARALDEE